MKQSFIRLAGENDIEELSGIIKKYRAFYGIVAQDIVQIKEFVTARIINAESKIFIAVNEKTNSITGFMQFYPVFSTVALKPQWLLNDLYVEEAERRKGIATALLNTAVEYFKDKAKGFILVTAKTNAEAKCFYDKHGWETDMYDFYTYTF